MLSAQDRERFRERGVLRLERALAPARVAPIRAHVTGELARLSVGPSGRRRAATHRAPFEQTTELARQLRYPELGDAITPLALLEAVRTLAASRVLAPQCQLLVTPPSRRDWVLVGLPWHTDVTATDRKRTSGVQVFALLDDVAPRGGATLAIAGSHRLPAQSPEHGDLRRIARESADLVRDLAERGLELVEMHGRRGDVYLMDMRVLHAPSVNATDKVRMMATARYLVG